MRSLSRLMEEYEELWFIIDDEVKDSFVDECLSNGIVFINGDEFSSKRCGPRMGINSKSKTIGYIAGMGWHGSFSHANALIVISESSKEVNGTSDSAVYLSDTVFIRLNYKAYISGDDNCVYESYGDILSPISRYESSRAMPPGAPPSRHTRKNST